MPRWPLKTFSHVDSNDRVERLGRGGTHGQLASRSRASSGYFIVQWIASEKIGRSTITVAW